MSCEVNINDLKSCLLSTDFKLQIAGLEEAKRLAEEIADSAVQGLARSSNKVIYADWLSRLGPMIVPNLQEIYRSSEGETRTAAAIMLLYFGDRIGLRDVIGALKMDDPYQFLAASKLANAQVVEAAKPISALLKKYVFTLPLDDEAQASTIHTLLSALRKLKVEIPADIMNKLTEPGVSKYISALVTKSMRKDSQ